MSLPIDDILPTLVQQLGQFPLLVLEAPPGAGKTTGVPPALLSAEWLKDGKILMLEPRRLAARGAAEFMARQMGERVGQTVGYSIRHEQRRSAQTRIEVITEGILTRRLQSDPELAGVGLVIFDEFHERNIHSDLALALTNDLRKGLREELRILVMSATVESEPLVKLLGARHIRSEGRSWPVKTLHLGGELQLDCVVPMTSAIERALTDTSGDILAFLPGVREIEQLRRTFSARHPELQISPLHSRLGPAEQQRAIQKSAQRKLILATNIAETSLTIDGVCTVVDSGLCRQMEFDPGSGLSRLRTQRISQASSRQRTGRAGRQGPGTCYRLWSEGAQETLLPQTPPEIRNADLTPLALDLCAWGVKDVHQLDWLDPPPAGALSAAFRQLEQLALIDHRGRLSDEGQRALRLPVHPRFASLMFEAERMNLVYAGCLLCTYLNEPTGLKEERSDDLGENLNRFAAELLSAKGRPHAAMQTFQQLVGLFDGRQTSAARLDDQQLAQLLRRAYPERIAYSKEQNGDYLMANSRGVRLTTQSRLRRASWLVIADISQHESSGALIRQALPLDKDWLAAQLETTAWQAEVFWDNISQRVVGRRVKRLGAIQLCAENRTPTAEQTLQAVCAAIRRNGESLLSWGKEAEQFLMRLNLLHETLGHPWPDVRREKLRERPEEWLAPFLTGISNATQLKKLDLLPALQSLLDWRQRRAIDELAPLRVEVPSGEKMKIDYQADGPSLPVKLQQLFGLADTPSICRGQRPLKLQLLSPAGRPLAVTSDLRSFWDTVYPEVRKEMKGRYPKHPWPDDPWQATPTRRTKKAGV